MKKNKLLKFIGIFEIIVFSLLLLVGLVSLAMALFQKFEVKAVLDFVNDNMWFVEELNLYVINFFDNIYLSLELGKIEFIANLSDYLHIIYTGIFVFFALLGFILAITTTKAGSGKAKGKGGVVTGAILYLLLAGALTAFAVYFFLYTKEIEAVVTPIAENVFGLDGFTYSPLINKVLIYAIPGTLLFIMLFQFIGVFTSKVEGTSNKEKTQKASNKDMGSYKPKMKPADDVLELKQNQTAEYMKYQDSKSENPYINGNAELEEDDLFSDLKPKPKEEEKKEEKPINPFKPLGTTQNNPFASSFNRPTPQPINTFNQTNNYGYTNPSMQNQYNTFNRPMPFGQPAQPVQQTQPVPTNINLTINPVAAAPNSTPQTVQVVQTPAANIKATGADVSQTVQQTSSTTKAAPKSADEAFKPKPKAPTQAVAKPKAPDMNLTEKLKELSALRQSGSISDDEYKALKQKAFQKFLKS